MASRRGDDGLGRVIGCRGGENTTRVAVRLDVVNEGEEEGERNDSRHIPGEKPSEHFI